jgi:polyisoprenoid-binding protein YceI
MHGVTKPVVLDLEFTGAGKDPWGNEKAGFSARGKVNRKDFGIIWNKTVDNGGYILGDEVEVTLEIEADAKKPEAKK